MLLRRSGLVLALTGASLMTTAVDAGGAPLSHVTGDWGGAQARLAIFADGGRLDLSCASASLDTPLVATGNGGFSASGHYEEFGGGPTLADAAPALIAARFTGRVDGDVMQLSMQVHGAAAAQHFTLERGRRVKLVRCL